MTCAMLLWVAQAKRMHAGQRRERHQDRHGAARAAGRPGSRLDAAGCCAGLATGWLAALDRLPERRVVQIDRAAIGRNLRGRQLGGIPNARLPPHAASMALGLCEAQGPTFGSSSHRVASRHRHESERADQNRAGQRKEPGRHEPVRAAGHFVGGLVSLPGSPVSSRLRTSLWGIGTPRGSRAILIRLDSRPHAPRPRSRTWHNEACDTRPVASLYPP